MTSDWSNNDRPQVDPRTSTLDLRFYAGMLRRRWWLVAITILVVTGVSTAVTVRQDNVYEAEAQLFVGQQTISRSEIAFAQNLTQTSLALVKSYAAAIKTRPIAQQVVAQLNLRERPDDLRSRVTADPIPETQIIRVKFRDRIPLRAQLVTNSLSEAFIESLGRIDPSDSGESAVKVSVLEPAVVPGDPISPKPVQNALASFLVGVLLSAGVVLLAERLDSTMKGREDTESAAGRPVLAIVPHVKTAKGAIVNAQGSPAGEAYRSLRSAIQHAGEDRPIRILAVTSPESADGKTSTSFNLAAAFAEGGVQAYLVEADMRKPTLARNLNYAPEKGLSSLLSNSRGSVDNSLRRTPFPFLHVLPAGQQTKEASELLLRPRFKEIVDDLAERSRIVLVDTPPILAVSDAASLAKVVDGFLLVVRAGKTKEEQVRESMRILNGAGADVIGIVVNDLDRSQALGYGYGYYGYGYSSYGPEKEPEDLATRARTPARRSDEG